MGFWKPSPNATQYSVLANAVGKAIKSSYPMETYVGPATSGVDLPYLRAVFQTGALQWFDAVSVHAYQWLGTPPEHALGEFAALQTLISQYSPAGKHVPIISGEWGYTTCHPSCKDRGPQTTPEQQAQYLARRFLMERMADIPVSIWYDWRDGSSDPTERESNFGTVMSSYHNASSPFTPKPSYNAAVAYHAVWPHSSMEFAGRIPALASQQSRNQTYILAFQNNTVPDAHLAFAVWMAGKQSAALNFSSPSTASSCNISSGSRLPCGGDDVNASVCAALGCCFDKSALQYRCYFHSARSPTNVTFPVPSTSGDPISSFATAAKRLHWASNPPCYGVVDYTGLSKGTLCGMPCNRALGLDASTMCVTAPASESPLYLMPTLH